MKLLSFANALSQRDITSLYQRFVLTNNNPAYLHKYATLPLHLNTGWKWEGHDLGRVISLLEFREYALKYGGFTVPKALFINGTPDPEAQFVRAGKIDYCEYDERSGANDLHTLNLPHKDYGFITTNQTLEHLYHPYLCVQNVYAHLAKGGYFYVNVPALNIPHSTPFHFYTGFTPVGLATMLVSVGFELLEVGQWGNFEYIQKIYRDHDWPDYLHFTNYINEFENPVGTWALARK